MDTSSSLRADSSAEILPDSKQSTSDIPGYQKWSRRFAEITGVGLSEEERANSLALRQHQTCNKWKNELVNYSQYTILSIAIHIYTVYHNYVSFFESLIIFLSSCCTCYWLLFDSSLIYPSHGQLYLIGYLHRSRSNVYAQAHQRNWCRSNTRRKDFLSSMSSLASRRVPPKCRRCNAVWRKVLEQEAHGTHFSSRACSYVRSEQVQCWLDKSEASCMQWGV